MDRNTRHEMMVQFAKFDQVLNEITVNMHNNMLILHALDAEVLRLGTELKELQDAKEPAGLGMGDK